MQSVQIRDISKELHSLSRENERLKSYLPREDDQFSHRDRTPERKHSYIDDGYYDPRPSAEMTHKRDERYEDRIRPAIELDGNSDAELPRQLSYEDRHQQAIEDARQALADSRFRRVDRYGYSQRGEYIHSS